jgi:hypothetical protein
MAKGLRERVGKQYKGTQRTRKAVHGECTVELAKWTFPIISLSREPYEAKVSRTGLTGGMGRRTARQRALCLPSEKLLCEQRWNLSWLPGQGRRIGRQCQKRESGPIVLDGVTSVQGVRESRTQGEGV